MTFDPQAARERCEAASETPWTVGTEPQLNMVAECGDTRNGQSIYVFAYRLASAEADADFIAHAREDLPAALEALEEAQGAIGVVREAWEFVEEAITDSDVHTRHAPGKCDSCDAIWAMLMVVRDCILKEESE